MPDGGGTIAGHSRDRLAGPEYGAHRGRVPACRMSISCRRSTRSEPAATVRRWNWAWSGWWTSTRGISPADARCSRSSIGGPRRRLVGLDVAGNKPAHNALLYAEADGKREIGSVTSAMWSPTCKRNIALAMVDAPYFQVGLDGLGGHLFEPRTRVGAPNVASARSSSVRFSRRNGAVRRRRRSFSGSACRRPQPKSIADRPWLDPDAKPQIVIEGVNKTFGAFTAVDSVNLRIYKGEMFALVGASGCGKTTLLRMLAGFATPSSGRIMIEDADMTSVPPHERPVNMMFQSYALFPHMTVEDNVGYGLRRMALGQGRQSSSEFTRRSRWCSLAATREAQAAPAVRRPATAGRAGARADPPAQGAAARRAVERPRQETA